MGEVSWVLGRNGLLGHNVERALRRHGSVWSPGYGFSWNDLPTLGAQFFAASKSFARVAAGGPWNIAWCAGTGIVASEQTVLEKETDALRLLLESLTDAFAGQAGSGAVFLASSAGGVYAGSKNPPFNELTPERPISPYGWNKLAQEEIAIRWSERTSHPLLIGRLSNLYGPGQNLAKAQGLISQACLHLLTRQPLRLYVSLDTIRDYLFAPDAAEVIADGLFRMHGMRTNQPGLIVRKILASGQPTTVATVLAQLRCIMKRPVRFIATSSPNASRQVRDLRFDSSVWTELDRFCSTPLSSGMALVIQNALKLAGKGLLHPSVSEFS